jgi:uncharacterized protein
VNLGLLHLTISLKYPLLAISCCGLFVADALAASPSFDCRRVKLGSIEELVCKDDNLAALDRKLAEVYASSAQRAVNEHPPMLKAEQRGWIKGRNECWKSADRRKCAEVSYRLRIAELQARYRLIPETAAVRYLCDGDARNAVTATFFQTDPPTLIAERGDSVSLMYLQPSASGARYQGRNETIWEHHGEALITWGYGGPEMRCQKTPVNPCPLATGSAEWRQAVERVVGTGDNAGHGPDVGSKEWMSSVSRKLGIYDAQGHGPELGSDEWQVAVHRLVFHSEPDH